MLMEMVEDFASPQLFCGTSILDNSRRIKKGRWETKSMMDRGGSQHFTYHACLRDRQLSK